MFSQIEICRYDGMKAMMRLLQRTERVEVVISLRKRERAMVGFCLKNRLKLLTFPLFLLGQGPAVVSNLELVILRGEMNL